MRDKYKNEDYFINYIENCLFLVKRTQLWLEDGTVPAERKFIAVNQQYRKHVQIIWAKYSMGADIENLLDDYHQALNYMHSAWLNLPLKAYKNNVFYDHYFGGTYDDMLEMLSFAILFNEPKETFLKLAEIIDKDNVKDLLYEFILKIKIPERELLVEESYSVIQNMPNEFKNLRAAIKEHDKQQTAKLVLDFFTKDWIKRAKKEGGKDTFNDYDNPNNTYSGYWNFYVPAISLLLEIDTSAFETHPYFPKDLYDYAKLNTIRNNRESL